MEISHPIQDTRVSSSFTPLPFMQYHRNAEIFHNPCASAIGELKGLKIRMKTGHFSR